MKAGQVQRMLDRAGGVKGLERMLGRPLSDYYHDCHAGSLAVVRTGVFGTPGEGVRVARGGCKGVLGQHSWIVIGADPYRPSAVVADPTLWSYRTGVKPYVAIAPNSRSTWVPHGSGSIWQKGHPDNCDPAQAVELDWAEPPSGAAQVFLDALGPLDKHGWIQLAHYPVEGWPAGEIIGAIADTFGKVHVPVDILGMVTDRNPGGLYW